MNKVTLLIASDNNNAPQYSFGFIPSQIVNDLVDVTNWRQRTAAIEKVQPFLQEL